MNNANASTYRDHTIEPLVYPEAGPYRKGLPHARRYLAAVTVTHLPTGAARLARLPQNFEFFGDARRAAEAHGRLLIDSPPAMPDAEAPGAAVALSAALHVALDAAAAAFSARQAQPPANPFGSAPLHAATQPPTEPKPGDPAPGPGPDPTPDPSTPPASPADPVGPPMGDPIPPAPTA